MRDRCEAPWMSLDGAIDLVSLVADDDGGVAGGVRERGTEDSEVAFVILREKSAATSYRDQWQQRSRTNLWANVKRRSLRRSRTVGLQRGPGWRYGHRRLHSVVTDRSQSRQSFLRVGSLPRFFLRIRKQLQ